jgi:hypothetical protein
MIFASPFGNLLVMMKRQSMKLHSVKDRFGSRRFGYAGQGCGRLSENCLPANPLI